jgi:hypothetical protein
MQGVVCRCIWAKSVREGVPVTPEVSWKCMLAKSERDGATDCVFRCVCAMSERDGEALLNSELVAMARATV